MNHLDQEMFLGKFKTSSTGPFKMFGDHVLHGMDLDIQEKIFLFRLTEAQNLLNTKQYSALIRSLRDEPLAQTVAKFFLLKGVGGSAIMQELNIPATVMDDATRQIRKKVLLEWKKVNPRREATKRLQLLIDEYEHGSLKGWHDLKIRIEELKETLAKNS